MLHALRFVKVRPLVCYTATAKYMYADTNVKIEGNYGVTALQVLIYEVA